MRGLVAAAALVLASIVLGACDAEPPDELTAIAVLRYDRVNDCYAALTPESIAQQVVDHMKTKPCAAPAGTTELRAGVDQVAVVIDYGAAVHFTHSASIPTPTVAVTLDGVAANPAIVLSNPQRGTDDRVFFIATFATPTALSRNVALSVTVSAAFQHTVATRFQIVPPAPAISLLAYRFLDPPCWDDLTAAGDAPVDPIVGLTLCPRSEPPAPEMVAAVDQMLLIADYGADVQFDAVSAAPRPQYSILIDGAAASGAIASTASSPADQPGRVIFQAPFTAPSTPSEHVVVTARAMGDNGFVKSLGTTFKIVPPTPMARLLRFISTDNCYEDLTTNASTEAPVALPYCPTSDSTTLRAGVDRLTILVDYGAGLHFAAPSAVPAPTLSLVLDGEPQSTTIAAGTAFVTSTGRAYFLADAIAPSRLAASVKVAMSVAGGFQVDTSTRASIVAPSPSLVISACAATGCTRTAGVGNAIAIASAPGPGIRSITFRTYVDGLLQNGTVTVMTTPAGDHSEVTQSFSVPPAAEGSHWMIEAVLDGVPVMSPTITLTEPHPTAELTCGTACTLVAGVGVGLTVVAPDEIHDAHALVEQRLNGLPLAPMTLTLAEVDHVAHTITGRQTITAPTGAGTWTIDVSVLGYHASTLSATVTVP